MEIVSLSLPSNLFYTQSLRSGLLSILAADASLRRQAPKDTASSLVQVHEVSTTNKNQFGLRGSGGNWTTGKTTSTFCLPETMAAHPLSKFCSTAPRVRFNASRNKSIAWMSGHVDPPARSSQLLFRDTDQKHECVLTSTQVRPGHLQNRLQSIDSTIIPTCQQ